MDEVKSLLPPSSFYAEEERVLRDFVKTDYQKLRVRDAASVYDVGSFIYGVGGAEGGKEDADGLLLSIRWLSDGSLVTPFVLYVSYTTLWHIEHEVAEIRARQAGESPSGLWESWWDNELARYWGPEDLCNRDEYEAEGVDLQLPFTIVEPLGLLESILVEKSQGLQDWSTSGVWHMLLPPQPTYFGEQACLVGRAAVNEGQGSTADRAAIVRDALEMTAKAPAIHDGDATLYMLREIHEPGFGALYFLCEHRGEFSRRWMVWYRDPDAALDIQARHRGAHPFHAGRIVRFNVEAR